MPSAECVFCRIVAGAEPAWVVYADEHAVAFLDRAPATTGHTLVVPRAHAVDIWDIGRRDYGRLMESAHAVAGLLDRRLHPDGLTQSQANRAAGWQDVFHVHIHLVPRYAGDQLTKSWVARPAATQELDAVLSQLAGSGGGAPVAEPA